MSCKGVYECFTLTWEIENFNILLTTDESLLTSATWKTETTEKKALWWCLSVCLSGPHFEIHLDCLNESLTPDLCEISFISFCGEILPLPIHPVFGFYHVQFYIEKVSLFSNNMHFKDFNVSLKCQTWENTMKKGEFRIHSVLQRVDFPWNISFNRNKPIASRKKIIEKDNVLINMNLCKEVEDDIFTVCVEALPKIYGSFSFVNSKVIISGMISNNISEYVKSTEYNILRTGWKKGIMIPNRSCDLTLQLESIVAHHTGADGQNQITCPTTVQTLKAGSIPEAVNNGSLSEGLLNLYTESILSDVTINSESKSFSTHRSILAARSPVFRAMFEKDEIGEERSRKVDIDDVDSETMDRMLVFLYGGILEDLQLEEAFSLYYAADKYAILPLKQKCANILKAGLTADSSCDVLVFADRLSDEQLMKCVVDVIYDHQEVVSSSKWEELEESRPRLVAKITKELFLKKGKK